VVGKYIQQYVGVAKPEELENLNARFSDDNSAFCWVVKSKCVCDKWHIVYRPCVVFACESFYTLERVSNCTTRQWLWK